MVRVADREMQAMRQNVRLILASAALALVAGAARANPPPPVYVHMNGANMFLERTVFIRPGQKLVFVNQDTGPHGLQGYNPATGKLDPRFHDTVLPGTKGAGHTVHSFTVTFRHQGVFDYFCPVHAMLMKAPGPVWAPMKRPTVHGFGTPMSGEVIVTTDRALLADNPKTAHERIVPGYFGG
ncbi:MAG: Cupredoxin [Rhodospirillales bacterium]|nr:Cupredoxin [Rhodospirillales bacterium]